MAKAPTQIPHTKPSGDPHMKANFDALSVAGKKNWINFSDPESPGDAIRIRPNFTSDSHLVCHYDPKDGKYDDCYYVPKD